MHLAVFDSKLPVQEHLALLRLLALRLPASFPALAPLANPDDEIDFCSNIAHIQLHRRSRALRRLAVAAAAGQLAPGTLLGVVLPLIQQMVVEGTIPRPCAPG